MPIDLQDYFPISKDWYVDSGVYCGSGTLRVAGVVKTSGPMKVFWNDVGETTITMELQSDHASLAHELLGVDAITVELRTDEGSLYVADRVLVQQNGLRFGAEGLSANLRLTAVTSMFLASSSEDPYYWAIPAVNFIADLHFTTPALMEHPLRIYSAPKVSEELRGNEAICAKLTANKKERLLPFVFADQPAFVERFVDYETKVESLKTKRADHHATAIIVGCIPPRADITLEGIFSWLPTDVFHALSVATGTYVGSGFVEFRSLTNIR